MSLSAFSLSVNPSTTVFTSSSFLLFLLFLTFYSLLFFYPSLLPTHALTASFLQFTVHLEVAARGKDTRILFCKLMSG